MFSVLEAGLRGGLFLGTLTVGLWTRSMGVAGREWVGLVGSGCWMLAMEVSAFCSLVISGVGSLAAAGRGGGGVA